LPKRKRKPNPWRYSRLCFRVVAAAAGKEGGVPRIGEETEARIELLLADRGGRRKKGRGCPLLQKKNEGLHLREQKMARGGEKKKGRKTTSEKNRHL